MYGRFSISTSAERLLVENHAIGPCEIHKPTKQATLFSRHFMFRARNSCRPTKSACRTGSGILDKLRRHAIWMALRNEILCPTLT
mmetsp:Transcript_15876/g.43852  ORF Transcript_15876/g.43852 Transcript_15876/m.43852 type:complete len:85 (+) Transcript_15876:890-1144(+)